MEISDGKTWANLTIDGVWGVLKGGVGKGGGARLGAFGESIFYREGGRGRMGEQ